MIPGASSAPRRQLCLVALFTCVALVACGEPWPLSHDPRDYPYRLELEASLPNRALSWDLDGDGRHELVRSYRLAPSPWPQLDAIVIYRPDGTVIDQVNFHGRILPPLTVDFDGDGVAEILAPLVRGDSLFATIVNREGRKVRSLFLVAGAPRPELDGAIPWDPTVTAAFGVDINADGRGDLLTVVNTGYARLPRGVFAHDLSTGERLGHVVIGAGIRHAFLDDFDRDGDKELVVGTVVTNNGAVAGGLDDGHQYFLVIELHGGPHVDLAINQGKSILQSETLQYDDFDGDGTREFVSFVSAPNGSNAKVRLIQPGSWRALRERDLPWQNVITGHARLDRDVSADIYVLGPSGEAMVLNGALDVVQAPRSLGAVFYRLDPTGDLDGDGTPELVGERYGQSVIFSSTFFTPLASLAMDTAMSPAFSHGAWRRTYFGFLKRDAGPARLLVYRADRSDVLRLVPNRFYLLFRYRAQLATLALALIAPTALVGMTRLRQRNRLLQLVQSLALDRAPSGYVLMRRDARVAWMNATLREWVGVSRSPRLPHTDSLSDSMLREVCRTLSALDPPRHHESTGTLDSTRPVRISAEPIDVRSGRADWLVRVEDTSRDGTPSESLSWALLAERVTHDLKAPLNNLRLILWNMKREHRAVAPSAAPQLDELVNSAEVEVDHARRLATNFMKLLRSEEARLELLNVHDLAVACTSGPRAAMQTRVEFRLRSTPDAPRIRGDREQLESVLENVVSNAVNAMPNGGLLTVTTGYGRARLGSETAGFQECALIEVADTGVGIDPGVLHRVFEPGFTTRPLGSGVGLAMAKRVVTNHGGRIDIQSHVGTGTVLSINLPIAQPTPDLASTSGHGQPVVG